MSSNFKIGTANNIYDFLPLDEIFGEPSPGDPDWSFQPFSTSVRLANGILQGNGFPVAKWRWNGMSDPDRQLLRDVVGSNLSAEVYIRTATNEVDDVYGTIVFKAYSCIMNWTDTDEDFQGDKVLGLIITFTHLAEVTE
jgi:hypothetical protein